jgi:hypothetical protein
MAFQAVSQTSTANTLLACRPAINATRCITYLVILINLRYLCFRRVQCFDPRFCIMEDEKRYICSVAKIFASLRLAI